MVKPGNLVTCSVVRQLENGLLVKFLKVFHGTIFIDHLVDDIANYKKGLKFKARIVQTDFKNKSISLS